MAMVVAVARGVAGGCIPARFAIAFADAGRRRMARRAHADPGRHGRNRRSLRPGRLLHPADALLPLVVRPCGAQRMVDASAPAGRGTCIAGSRAVAAAPDAGTVDARDLDRPAGDIAFAGLLQPYGEAICVAGASWRPRVRRVPQLARGPRRSARVGLRVRRRDVFRRLGAPVVAGVHAVAVRLVRHRRSARLLQSRHASAGIAIVAAIDRPWAARRRSIGACARTAPVQRLGRDDRQGRREQRDTAKPLSDRLDAIRCRRRRVMRGNRRPVRVRRVAPVAA